MKVGEFINKVYDVGDNWALNESLDDLLFLASIRSSALCVLHDSDIRDELDDARGKLIGKLKDTEC